MGKKLLIVDNKVYIKNSKSKKFREITNSELNSKIKPNTKVNNLKEKIYILVILGLVISGLSYSLFKGYWLSYSNILEIKNQVSLGNLHNNKFDLEEVITELNRSSGNFYHIQILNGELILDFNLNLKLDVKINFQEVCFYLGFEETDIAFFGCVDLFDSQNLKKTLLENINRFSQQLGDLIDTNLKNGNQKIQENKDFSSELKYYINKTIINDFSVKKKEIIENIDQQSRKNLTKFISDNQKTFDDLDKIMNYIRIGLYVFLGLFGFLFLANLLVSFNKKMPLLYALLSWILFLISLITFVSLLVLTQSSKLELPNGSRIKLETSGIVYLVSAGLYFFYKLFPMSLLR